MRIISGKYRHRNIVWPVDNINIRPTKDRIREAIFSSLGDITNLKVLDLYGGSGAMAIEALSRDASYAYIVDNNKIARDTILSNLSSLSISNAKMLFMDADKALQHFVEIKETFDIVFLDPPYEKGDYIGNLNFLLNNNLINNNGIIVIERNKELNYDSFDFKNIKVYHYGEISVDVIRL